VQVEQGELIRIDPLALRTVEAAQQPRDRLFLLLDGPLLRRDRRFHLRQRGGVPRSFLQQQRLQLRQIVGQNSGVHAHDLSNAAPRDWFCSRAKK